MKNEKGVTLVSLVITIIVLLILATVSIYAGTGTIRYANYNKAKAEMEKISSQVNAWNEEYLNVEVKDEEIEEGQTREQVKATKQQAIIEKYGVSTSDSSCDQTILNTTIQATGIIATNYRFLSEEYLKQNLGLDASFEYLINIVSRDVILFGGVSYNDQTYYTLSDFDITNVAENLPSSISFNLAQGENTDIIISDLKLIDSNSNEAEISKFIVEYKKTTDENWSDATANVTKFTDAEDNNKTKYKFSVEKGSLYNIKVLSIDKSVQGISTINVVKGNLEIAILGEKQVKLVLNVETGAEYKYKIYAKDGQNEELRIVKQGTSSENIIETNAIDTFFDVGIEDSYVELENNGTLITTNHCTYEDLKIKTAEELKFFGTRVNGGKGFANKTITQVADIDLQGNESNQWSPIANASEKFWGTYDGTNHSINNLYINNEMSYQGLFGYNDGIIKNLMVSGNVTSTARYSGGIGGINNGRISNCTTNILVRGNNRTGGIVGYNNGTISDCYNINNIELTIENSNFGDAGGIAGRNDRIIIRCKNIGNIVSVNNSNCIGGIVGDNSGTVDMCFNKGNISGESGVGGILGYSNSSNSIVSNSYNLGEISGNSRVGGILGNSIMGSVINCYNINSASATDMYSGSIVGFNSSGDIINNSYYLNTLNENLYGYNEGIIDNLSSSMSETEMKNGTLLNLLNTDGANWKADYTGEASINNGYPILNWQ